MCPLFGMAFPWETAEGEGFIAPWTPREMTPQGLIQAGTEVSEVVAVNLEADYFPPAYQVPVAPPYVPPVFSLEPNGESPYLPPPINGFNGIEPLPYVSPPVYVPPVAPTLLPTVVPTPGLIPVSNGTSVFPASQPTHGDVVPGLLGTLVNGVPISGPGVPEPPRQMIAKHWHVKFESQTYGTFQMFYWKLIDGRCMSYHSPTKTWKIWRPKKHIVISRNPRVSNLRQLGRLNKRVEKMLRPFQPKARGFPAKALARTYLSTAERKLLK